MYGYLYFAQTELRSTLDQNTQSRISKKCYTIAIVENDLTKLKREYRKLRDGLRGHDGANRQHREFKDDLHNRQRANKGLRVPLSAKEGAVVDNAATVG